MKKGLIQAVIVITGAFILSAAAAERAHGCVYDKCMITSYGSLHHDSITIAMEIHGYFFNVVSGDALIIRAVNVDDNFDPKLELINPQGNVIASAGIPGTGIAEITTRQITQDGNYVITIKDFMGNGRGAYYLSVQSVNRPQNARSLIYDQYLRDTLFSPGELNAYQFNALAGDMVSIQMIAISQPLEPYVRLYGPKGGFIAGDIDYEYAAIANRILSDSGKYTIIACDDVSDDVGEYFLILSKLPADVDGGEPGGLPLAFALEQNHPNPFNPNTAISFGLPRSSSVSLIIYNVLGETVRSLVSDRMGAGWHEVTWDGRDESGGEVPSGIYFYRLVTDEFSESRKMLLLK